MDGSLGRFKVQELTSQTRACNPEKPNSVSRLAKAFLRRLGLLSNPEPAPVPVVENVDFCDEDGNYAIHRALLDGDPIFALKRLRENGINAVNEKNNHHHFPSDIILSDRFPLSSVIEAVALFIELGGVFKRYADMFVITQEPIASAVNPLIEKSYEEDVAAIKLLEAANETLGNGEEPLTMDDIRTAVLPLDSVTVKLQGHASGGRIVDPGVTAALGGIPRRNPENSPDRLTA